MRRRFETERLMLRVLDKSSALLVLDYFLRNKDFLEEWEPVRGESFYTMEFQEGQLDVDLMSTVKGDTFKYWISKKEEPERIIGSVSFNCIIRGSFLSCFLGYRSDKDELRKGFMSEAIKRGIGIIFDEYGLHRIEANIMPRNTGSLKLVEKLGFHNEGLAVRYLRINGKWEDHVRMTLLNE